MTRELSGSQWYSSNFCRVKDDVVTPETFVVVDNFERKQLKKKIFPGITENKHDYSNFKNSIGLEITFTNAMKGLKVQYQETFQAKMSMPDLQRYP